MTREELFQMVELLRDTAKLHQPNEEILTDVKAESFIFIMDSVLSALSVPEREKGTNGEIIKAIFPEGNEFDIKKYQYKAWTAKNKSDFSVEMSVEFWNAEYKGSFSVPEREKGEWIEKEGYDGDTYYDCSACGESWTTIEGTPWDNGMNFCPNCGADMRGGKE